MSTPGLILVSPLDAPVRTVTHFNITFSCDGGHAEEESCPDLVGGVEAASLESPPRRWYSPAVPARVAVGAVAPVSPPP
jgi:hypothetical protein